MPLREHYGLASEGLKENMQDIRYPLRLAAFLSKVESSRNARYRCFPVPGSRFRFTLHPGHSMFPLRLNWLPARSLHEPRTLPVRSQFKTLPAEFSSDKTATPSFRLIFEFRMVGLLPVRIHTPENALLKMSQFSKVPPAFSSKRTPPAFP
jgi:hypothetical protein